MSASSVSLEMAPMRDQSPLYLQQSRPETGETDQIDHRCKTQWKSVISARARARACDSPGVDEAEREESGAGPQEGALVTTPPPPAVAPRSSVRALLCAARAEATAACSARVRRRRRGRGRTALATAAAGHAGMLCCVRGGSWVFGCLLLVHTCVSSRTWSAALSRGARYGQNLALPPMQTVPLLVLYIYYSKMLLAMLPGDADRDT